MKTFPFQTPNLVASWAVTTETTWATLNSLLLRNWNDVDWDGIETERLEEILGLDIDIELSTLGVLGEVEGGNFWDVLILALTLLLLKLEGDTTDWTSLNALHQVYDMSVDTRGTQS